jgi:type IV secretory pathway VirB9-like protein
MYMRTLNRFFLLFTISFAVAHGADTAPARVDNPRTVVVGERSVVDVYVSQFQDTLLVLPPAEKVRQTFIGDSANWVLNTGKTDEPNRYISIKVKEPIVKQTTVNVLSDHDKSYTFRLILSEDHCDSKVFVDPDSQLSQELAKPPAFVSAIELEQVRKEAAEAKAESVQMRQREAAKASADTESFRAKYPSTLKFDYRWDQRQEKSSVCSRSSATTNLHILQRSRKRRLPSMK